MLDAAALRIAEKGFAATSVEDIVARAGYTRGAFYSNFSNTVDMFVELLRADHQHFREAIQALLDATPPGEDPQTQLASLVERYYRDDDSYIIWAEARLHAMRDASFRQRMNALCVERRDLIVSFIERCGERIGVRLPHSYADRALVAIALMDGIRYFNMTIADALPNAPTRKNLNDVFMRMLVDEWMLDMLGRQ
ncbi:TetR/AcrR family transcriptional regulator [Burkholderia sp. Ac-20353]|uniref:TetR/AcrR family transcriptional regulator n=1 Tax=Burkholderia sp. Ac-20353 TaxID=2703894 RepID=UPI001F11F9CD|nr:TetR/AcrR family transcriptional regulator [Burkholderia sp. Ac-20353]